MPAHSAGEKQKANPAPSKIGAVPPPKDKPATELAPDDPVANRPAGTDAGVAEAIESGTGITATADASAAHAIGLETDSPPFQPDKGTVGALQPSDFDLKAENANIKQALIHLLDGDANLAREVLSKSGSDAGSPRTEDA